MLLPTEWASRVGLNPSLIDEDPLKPQAIGALVIWRGLSLGARSAWALRINEKASQTYPFSGNGAFWRELSIKKEGLFGAGTTTAVDPLAAYRHPWCLSTHEFAEAKAKIDFGEAPSNVVDERVRVSTVCMWIAPLLSIASPLGAVAKVLAPPLAVAGLAFGAIAGADAFYEKIGDWLETDAFKRELAKLREVYAREDRFRAVELQQPLAA